MFELVYCIRVGWIFSLTICKFPDFSRWLTQTLIFKLDWERSFFTDLIRDGFFFFIIWLVILILLHLLIFIVYFSCLFGFYNLTENFGLLGECVKIPLSSQKSTLDWSIRRFDLILIWIILLITGRLLRFLIFLIVNLFSHSFKDIFH